MGGIFKTPKPPPLPPVLPTAPAEAAESVRAAKLMERRKQLGLEGRDATWLTGARGDTTPPPLGVKTLLGS